MQQNSELLKSVSEWEMKCKLLQSKHHSDNDSRDQFLEYIKEIEEENQQLKNKIKADMSQLEKTRKVIHDVENYKVSFFSDALNSSHLPVLLKAELEEVKKANERLKKANATLKEESKRKKKALLKEHRDVVDEVVQQRKEIEALRDVHQTNEKLRSRIAELQKEKRYSSSPKTTPQASCCTYLE